MTSTRPAPRRPHRGVRALLVLTALAAGLAPAAASAAAMPGMPEMAFQAGTAARPLVARGPEGPLWSPTQPRPAGRAMHGTFAEQTVAAELAKARGEALASIANDDLIAERTVLSTAQATAKLTSRCRKLIKRSSKHLTKSDRRRRSKCLSQRRALINASKQPIVTGVTAPAPIVTVTPTPVASSDPATPTPSPAPGIGAPAPTPAPQPGCVAGQCYGAIGVTAVDFDQKFKVSRSTVAADVVSFELTNSDRQQHDLFIAPTDASGAPTAAPTQVIGLIDGGKHASANVALAPGSYLILCTVQGHGAMAVPITVTSPR